jgi:hypothetical protein
MSAPAPAVAGKRKSGGRDGAAAPLPPGVCPVLARFEVAWAELSAALPAHACVRMEGVDPAAVGAVKAAWLAVGYPMKWAKPTYACPPEVRYALRLVSCSGLRSSRPQSAASSANARARERRSLPCAVARRARQLLLTRLLIPLAGGGALCAPFRSPQRALPRLGRAQQGSLAGRSPSRAAAGAGRRLHVDARLVDELLDRPHARCAGVLRRSHRQPRDAAARAPAAESGLASAGAALALRLMCAVPEPSARPRSRCCRTW